MRGIGRGVWVPIAVFAAALVAAAVVAGSAGAQRKGAPPSEPPEWAYRLPHDLMSPFCPGRTLAECPSPQADQLRLWILTQAAAGASEAEVAEILHQRYGDQILSAPRAEGWGLAAYVLPLAGFVLGGLVVTWVLRRMVRVPAEGAPVAAAGPRSSGDPELERLLDEELGRS